MTAPLAPRLSRSFSAGQPERRGIARTFSEGPNNKSKENAAAAAAQPGSTGSSSSNQSVVGDVDVVYNHGYSSTKDYKTEDRAFFLLLLGGKDSI
jgi:hypothetical protein